MDSAFFDYHASTPVLPEVMDAMRPYWSDVFSPPSALHAQGLKARQALEEARGQIASLIGAESPEEILFTSGATESANMAVKGAAWAGRRLGNHLVLSAIEHPSVMQSVSFLKTQGFTATVVPVDSQGLVDPASIQEALTDQTILVCVHHANHDVGTLQRVSDITAMAADRGIPTFVDASTSGGWSKIDVGQMGASMVSLAPHRFFGPKGVGVLYRHRRARLQPLIHGGSQEENYRAGTENLAAIVGAGVAARVAERDLEGRMERVTRLQRMLWEGIQQRVMHLQLHGPAPGPDRIPTNLNFSVAHVEGEGLVLMSDVQGMALASGTSCVAKSLQASPVLEAMGVSRAMAQANVLLTLSHLNREGEVTYFLERFPKVVEKLRSMSPT